MEEKTIWVRVIKESMELTTGEIYIAINAINGYVIKSDKGNIHIYQKELFEKVEDVLMAECIDKGKELSLTLNKKYRVIEENEEGYLIINDKDVKNRYLKDRFKPVEPQTPGEKIQEFNGNKKTWMQEALEHVEPTIKEKIQEAISKSAEGNKIECINKKCKDNSNKTCLNKLVKRNSDCLLHEQVKENICYNEKCGNNDKNGKCKAETEVLRIVCKSRYTKQPTLINYEEEYNKLKKENEERKKTLEDALKEKNWHVSTFTKFNNLRYENIEYERINKELVKERDNYKEIAESQNKKIEEIEENLEGYNKENKEHIEYIQQIQEENKELKRLHENQRLNIKSEMSENRELKAKIVELESILDKERQETDVIYSEVTENRDRLLNENTELKKQNNQGYMEQMNKTLNEKNEEIERLTNLYNNTYSGECIVTRNNSKLEKEKAKLEDKIDNLKDIIVRLSELL